MFSFLKRGRWFFGLFLLLSLVVGEFWMYAANRLGGYMQQKAFGGASLADFCDSSDIAGFPFRLRLNCAGFSAPVRIGGGGFIVKTGEAHGEASIFAPNHVILTLSSPLSLQKADGAPFGKFRHDGLTFDVAWNAGGLDRASLDGAALDWRPDVPEAGVAFSLQKLTAQANWLASPSGGSVHFDCAGDGLIAPALQSLLNKTDPGRLILIGDLRPALGVVRDWRAAADDWRQKSGALGIDKLQWQAGDTTLTVDGALNLDESHRLAGRLNVAAKGAGPILKQIGIPTGLAQAQNIIGALLGKPTAKAEDRDVLALSLVLANGQVHVGPLRLPVTLPPLF